MFASLQSVLTEHFSITSGFNEFEKKTSLFTWTFDVWTAKPTCLLRDQYSGAINGINGYTH